MEEMRADIALSLQDEEETRRLAAILDAYDQVAGNDHRLTPQEMELRRSRIRALGRSHPPCPERSRPLLFVLAACATVAQADTLTAPQVHDRWRQELARRGDGAALAIAVLEAQLIAEHAAERDRYMAPFLAWDVDKDGVIDVVEAAAVRAADTRNGYDLEQFDINRDQQFTHDEILRVTQRRRGPFDLDDIAAMLIFDLDRDGFLTEPEINTVVDALADVSPIE